MKLTSLIEMATTTGGIAMGMTTLLGGDGYDLAKQRDKAKSKTTKKKRIMAEADHAIAAQSAAENIQQLKSEGLTTDQIIRQLTKDFSLAEIKDALKQF